MLASSAVRLAGRRATSSSVRRTLSSASRQQVVSSEKQNLLPYLAALGFAVGATQLSGHDVRKISFFLYAAFCLFASVQK